MARWTAKEAAGKMMAQRRVTAGRAAHPVSGCPDDDAEDEHRRSQDEHDAHDEPESYAIVRAGRLSALRYGHSLHQHGGEHTPCCDGAH